MELMVKALVIVVQLALAGFVIWGGWLCLREWLRGEHAAKAQAAPPLAVAARRQSFERVASLVLLALLCTTIIGLS
jgi:hypothetical protein